MSSLFDLSGRTAFVTGASSGIGRHLAITLSNAGARLVVAARRRDRLDDLVREIEARGQEALAVSLDVTEGASIVAGLDAAVECFGNIDILVNNSGITTTTPVLDIEESEWDQLMDTNLKGAFRVAQQCARRMVVAQKGGTIINMASIMSFGAAGQLTAYCASKAALMQMTRSFALELVRDHIRVNALAPGYILTDFNREFFATQAGQRLIRRIPQRRVGAPEDLDGPLLLLASDASKFMTGSAVTVDGGHLIGNI